MTEVLASADFHFSRPMRAAARNNKAVAAVLSTDASVFNTSTSDDDGPRKAARKHIQQYSPPPQAQQPRVDLSKLQAESLQRYAESFHLGDAEDLQAAIRQHFFMIMEADEAIDPIRFAMAVNSRNAAKRARTSPPAGKQ